MFLIRPAREGLLIPMPTGGDLPQGGAIATALDLYWQRRKSDGDATIDEVAADTVEAAIAEIAARSATADTAKKKG